MIAIFMWWLDWIANSCHVLQKVILLWRCEIQDALDHKSSLSIEKNIFVRFRQLLLPRTQALIVLVIFLYCASYNVILLIVYRDLAVQPCLTDQIRDNHLVLAEIILCWVTFLPVITFSTWSMQRLQKFPGDNWKVYLEARVVTPYTMIAALTCLIVLIVIPTVDGILFVHFVGPVVGSVFHFVLPLYLHRQMLAQLSRMDMNSLTSFEKLLENEEFLQAFSNFLKKEFSSENLFFWREVQHLKHKYGALLPEAQRPLEYDPMPDGPEELALWLKTAATKLEHLGTQFVGPTAPWQINISGFTAQDLEQALQKLRDESGDLQEALEEALVALVVVQQEVFELLRKDPYPRFLLTPTAVTLNKDGNFKRMLASEKLEDEAHKHTSSAHSKTEEKSNNSSNNSKNSKNSEKKDKKGRSKDQKSRTRGSENDLELSPVKQKQSTLQVRASPRMSRDSKRTQGDKASTSEQQPTDDQMDPVGRNSEQQPEPAAVDRSFVETDRSSDL